MHSRVNVFSSITPMEINEFFIVVSRSLPAESKLTAAAGAAALIRRP
jgi:hypothetical protein